MCVCVFTFFLAMPVSTSGVHFVCMHACVCVCVVAIVIVERSSLFTLTYSELRRLPCPLIV